MLYFFVFETYCIIHIWLHQTNSPPPPACEKIRQETIWVKRKWQRQQKVVPSSTYRHENNFRQNTPSITQPALFYQIPPLPLMPTKNLQRMTSPSPFQTSATIPEKKTGYSKTHGHIIHNSRANSLVLLYYLRKRRVRANTNTAKSNDNDEHTQYYLHRNRVH